MKRITIVLAHEHRIVRDALRQALHRQRDLRVMGEATHAREVLEQVRAHSPRVLVLDESLPLGGGRRVDPADSARLKTRTIALVVSGKPGDLPRLGSPPIHGWLNKQSDVRELILAIRCVAGGGDYCDPSLENVPSPQQGVWPSAIWKGGRIILSDREQEVLRRIALGHASKEVAAQLGVSIKSVETYKARLRLKLNVTDRAGLVRHAIRLGWMSGG